MQGSLDPTDPYYRGHPTPKHLKDGPVTERRCTDFLCLITFVAFWAGLVVIAITAFSTGNPMALTYPYDQFGNQCGHSQNTTGTPYIFFIKDSIDGFSANNTVCVSSCPNSTDSMGPNQCALDFTQTKTPCSSIPTYATTQLENFCVPVNSGFADDLANTNALSFGFAMTAVSDLKATWWMVIVVGVIALILGFLYLILMKHFAGVIIWTLLISFMLIFTGIGFLCLEDSKGLGFGPSLLTGLSPDLLTAIAVGSFIIALVTFILICVFRTRINLAIAVMKASADFIEDEPAILILPPVFFVKSLLFYIFWIFVAIYIIGMNSVGPAPNNTPIPDITWSDKTIGMLGYYVLGLFWNHAFSVALSQFIIASSVCIWYFRQGRSNFGSTPISTSIKRSIYHLGSIAFGSFLIGLLDILKMVLEVLAKQVKKSTTAPGAVQAAEGFCVSCCSCFVNCFEKSLKFINRHAYIQIAMTGESFCRAAEDAFLLLLRNALRFGTVHGVAAIFTFLGKIVVSLGATFVGYLIITRTAYFAALVTSPLLPTFLFLISSYTVAHVFMNIYGVTADTIIHCFAMDDEIHDGDVQFAPKELRDFMDNHADIKRLSFNQY